MHRIRIFLWKYLGMTLDRETMIVIGVVIVSCVATIVFGILDGITSNPVFHVLAFLSAAPAVLITIGSSYSAVNWSLSNESERKEIEENIALKQLRRRAKDKHYQR